MEFLSFLTHLRQSVFWQGRVGIQKIALFGKIPSSYYGKNSSKKQIKTTIHYFQTWRSVNPEHFKNLKKKVNTVAKTIMRYDETGSHEDRHRKERPRVTSAAVDKFTRFTSLRNCNPNKCFQSSINRHITTSTVQRLRESGLHGWITAKKPLLKDTNKKRLDWAKKHEQWILDRWKSVLWSDDSKLEIFGSHCEAWRRRCDGALLVTLSVIYLDFKAHLTSMATTAFCSDTPYHQVCP